MTESATILFRGYTHAPHKAFHEVACVTEQAPWRVRVVAMVAPYLFPIEIAKTDRTLSILGNEEGVDKLIGKPSSSVKGVVNFLPSLNWVGPISLSFPLSLRLIFWGVVSVFSLLCHFWFSIVKSFFLLFLRGCSSYFGSLVYLRSMLISGESRFLKNRFPFFRSTFGLGLPLSFRHVRHPLSRGLIHA